MGTPGQPGAYTQIDVPDPAPSSLFYYSLNSNGMGYSDIYTHWTNLSQFTGYTAIDIPASVYDPDNDTKTSAFTITIWAYHQNNFTAGTWQQHRVISVGDSPLINYRNNNPGGRDTINTNFIHETDLTTKSPLNKWTLYVITRPEFTQTTNVTFYVKDDDGSDTTNFEVSNNTDNNNTIKPSQINSLGKTKTSSHERGFWGYINDFRYYNRSFTSAEVDDLYNTLIISSTYIP